MYPMSQKLSILIISVFGLIVVGMFGFAYLKQAERSTDTIVVASSTTATPSVYGITRIDGKHFFIDGVHTIVGELAMPTPCDLLTAEAAVAESMPEQVTFAFTVINNSPVCAQVVTTQRFKVSATASDAAELRALFMGESVDLNLVEAAVGETPEEFELFMKG